MWWNKSALNKCASAGCNWNGMQQACCGSVRWFVAGVVFWEGDFDDYPAAGVGGTSNFLNGGRGGRVDSTERDFSTML